MNRKILLAIPLFVSCGSITLYAGDTSAQNTELAQKLATYRVGISRAQNEREYMEDRHQVMFDQQGSFFAVYDGHGGSHVAEYSAKNLHRYLFKLLASGSPETAINSAFQIVHQELDTIGEDHTGNPIANNQGSTAAIALIKDGHLHLAWAGDSRCVLARKGHIFEATEDHKPHSPAELERCTSAGAKFRRGYICDPEFTMGLGVARALGDKDLNKYGVIPTPEIKSLKLEPSDEFLIIASDGIWDVISNEEAISEVRHLLQLANGSEWGAKSAASRLVSMAKQAGSEDNLTAMVIALKAKLNDNDCDEEIVGNDDRDDSAKESSTTNPPSGLVARAPERPRAANIEGSRGWSMKDIINIPFYITFKLVNTLFG